MYAVQWVGILIGKPLYLVKTKKKKEEWKIKIRNSLSLCQNLRFLPVGIGRKPSDSTALIR